MRIVIYRRVFEVSAPDVRKLESYLVEEMGKVLSFPAFGFGPGCVVFCGIEVHSRSRTLLIGELRFNVEDILGNAAIAVAGRKESVGFIGLPMLVSARGFTSFDHFTVIDFDGRE
jgi:hypothetical protein